MINLSKPPHLTIELVPRTCWFSNVRSQVKSSDWNKLRREVYEAAANSCEICGGKGKKHPVECHEVWEYDDKNHVQKLVRMCALCPMCHRVKHIGMAITQGMEFITKRHLARVNGWSMSDAEHYIEASMEVWSIRSNYEWKLDLTYLDDLEIPYKNREGKYEADT